MLTATGNINQKYRVIGVVHAVTSRTPKSAGCGAPGGLPIQEAYGAVTQSLSEAARASGANGVIHIGYDYRMTTSAVGCGGNTQAVFDVYAWGTAIVLEH